MGHSLRPSTLVPHHYFTNEAEPLIKEAAAEAFLLIRALIVEHLEDTPVDLLGEQTWKVLLNASEVQEAERRECEKSFEKVAFRTDALLEAVNHCLCPACGSSLIKQVDADNVDQGVIELICSACGDTPEKEDVFEAALEEALWADNFISAKDGGEGVSETCPECDRESFIIGEGKCALCDFSLEGESCGVCKTPISIHEYNDEAGGLCSYCYYRAMKAMDD